MSNMMKFIGTIDGKQHEVVVESMGMAEGHEAAGFYRVSIDGRAFDVDARIMPHGIVSALMNHTSYDLDVDRFDAGQRGLDGQVQVRVSDYVVNLEMLSSQKKKIKETQDKRSLDGGIGHLTSPMPGKVTRCLVKAGDVVAIGQGLAVVEAMKMENELRATRAGVVREVFIKTGDPVEGGTLLLTIE
jgi:biotin carboxyl carrier protein